LLGGYQDLVKDIERLKWKLMEKDKDADKATMSGRKAGSTLQKSRSLEDSHASAASEEQRTYFEHQFDLRMQLETVQQEAAVLQVGCRSLLYRSYCVTRVCPYVRLSQAGIVSKRLNELACFFGMRGSFL